MTAVLVWCRICMIRIFVTCVARRKSCQPPLRLVYGLKRRDNDQRRSASSHRGGGGPLTLYLPGCDPRVSSCECDGIPWTGDMPTSPVLDLRLVRHQ